MRGGLARAAAALRAGDLVAFPTETVYGLGASTADPEAMLVTIILLLIMIREVFRPQVEKALGNIATTVLGVMYVGWLSSHFVMLRELPGSLGADPAFGARLVFFAALIIWACLSLSLLRSSRSTRTRSVTSVCNTTVPPFAVRCSLT